MIAEATSRRGENDAAEIEKSIQILLKEDAPAAEEKDKDEGKKQDADNDELSAEDTDGSDIKDIDQKAVNLESILDLREFLDIENAIDAEYMNVLMHDNEVPDYSKIFSYNKEKGYKPYDSYSAYSQEQQETVESFEMISRESVDKIIKKMVMKEKFKMNSEGGTLEEKEAFEIYKIFNKALVELKYETCLT